jgi:PAS domain S-box-containing protein
MKKTDTVSKSITYVKVLFPTLMTIGLFIVALFWVVIPQFENIILDRKREMLRELTYSAESMIYNWYRLEMNGELNRSQAQEAAIEQIKTLRYGDELKDYFWVTDLHPTMLTHPYRPDLNGKDLTEVYDSRNKKLFVEMVNVVNEKGEGFVDYMWQWKDDSTRIVPKLSYVKKFEPWGWVIGTGIYIEDVKEEIAQIEKNIITISILITALSSLFLFYIAFQNYHSERKRRIAEAELSESRERYRMLVEASGEGLIMILENQQVFFNKAVYNLLGYDESDNELELSKIFSSFPDSKTFNFKNLQRKNDSDAAEQLEAELLKKNGEKIDAFLVISPIKFLNNSGVVISVKDISRSKEIEEALDYTKEKYLALTSQLTIGVFRASPDNNARFTEINPALKNILGVKSDEEILSGSIFDYFADKSISDSIMNSLSDHGFIKNKAVQLKKSSGAVITVSLSAVMVKEVHGRPISIDGIIEDISEQRRTDMDKEKLIFDLQTSVLTLSQQVAGFVKELYTCSHNAPISEAIKIMTSYNCNAILVLGSNGEEIGFVTDRDLRERVIAPSVPLDEPVYKVMSSPIYTVSPTSTIYEALVKFRKKSIRRLVVKRADNSVAGILTIDDIFDASYTNFLFFIQNIENAETVNKISQYRDQLLILIRSLIEYNTNIQSITNFITLIADAITKRIIELAIQETGMPPAKFTFITMGSEGREEQTLATDQDNAIIYEDVPPEKEAEVQKYFNRLGEIISDNLAAAGYRYCKGNIMAKNNKWCQPYSAWKRYFTDWVTSSSPQDLLDIKIFFDIRSVYGDEELSAQLQKHIHHVTASFNTFFIYMSESVLNINIPDNMQKLKAPVDVKLLLLPVVDFARLYTIKQKLNETNTYRRLEAINDKGVISNAVYKSISYCYNFLMRLRLKHQIDCYDNDVEIDNIINPAGLTDVDKQLLKSYFDVLENLMNKIRMDFKGSKVL